MDCNEIKVPAEFSDICPFSDEVFHSEMAKLVEEPGFKHAVTYAMPNIDYDQFCQQLLKITNKRDFQVGIMHPFLEMLEHKTTAGVSCSGIEMIDDNVPNVFITNHRDIVLDSAQLSYLLASQGLDTVEIAIGNNLLIFEWITKLVRLNKSFIVKRNLGRLQTLAAAIQLSRYIHFAIKEKHSSVWLAQREGRCKDSNDRTQESLLKMLTYGNRDVSMLESLKELNIAPIAISYEYDPNDYLKATEFLLKSKDPNFKKSQEDDLVSMQTGIMGYKGKIHYSFVPCINEKLNNIPADLDKLLMIRRVCAIIDHEIHSNYKIFKTNYIAHDILFDNKDFADKYAPEECEAFKAYLDGQIAKVKVPYNELDRNFMYKCMLEMYSNPLTNQLEALK